MPRLLESEACQTLLNASPDPEMAARYLHEFERQHPAVFHDLHNVPSGVSALIAVFSYSRFLSETLLHSPNWLTDLLASGDLYRSISGDRLLQELRAGLERAAASEMATTCARFRRRRLLRIFLRDVLGLATLSEVTDDLSVLADTVLESAARTVSLALEQRYGAPTGAEGQACGMSIIALGKLGGRELNYSSDIDLMFVYGENGSTAGAESITNREFFKRLANSTTELLSTYTAEGMCFRVDLRLRPDGRQGEVCTSLEGARQYYSTRARDWELQMLIKARVAAGDPAPGRDLLAFVQPRIYRTTLDFTAVEAASATRERIGEKAAARRGSNGLDIKLTRGGIRDIEFLVQCLQRLHGGREPWVQHGGTLLALSRLQDKDFISAQEYGRLANAYTYLRHLEHRLQVLDDRQTHSLPQRQEDLAVLARKMPASELGQQRTPERLLQELNRHLEEVQETYDRVIHSQQPLYYQMSDPAGRDRSANNLTRFLDRTAPAMAQVLHERPLERGHQSFQQFLENLNASPKHLELLNSDQVLFRKLVDLFEHSPHFAEALIRRPQDIEVLFSSHMPQPTPLADPTQLRRYYRREMLRVEFASICSPEPVFTTLSRTSDVADTVIRAAYDIARSDVLRSHPPQNGHYEPRNQMMVIALGRLGMREFDLGSDADLNFVLPDGDAAQTMFWTRVAERMIDILGSYTGDGTLFTVDTRLRPNGREGMLVQIAGAYKEYIAKNAEAWEGISYMKSRGIAGDTDRATAFLGELQEADWRRYGQSGRSRADLRTMRMRLEREQGEANPLKAGPGGYYDIDFSLMYLRLKSAGIFFKVLNTPERIDIIERLGHLEREDAALMRDAATFYRAVDHGLRVHSGHAMGKLPQSEQHLQVLTNLVRRWTPPHLHDQPLPEELAQIQASTREFFQGLFK
jgi:glutamate-ammonia-ligase adenylyltransferase